MTDTNDRARLARLIGECRHNAKAEEIADALLPHVTLKPAPPRERFPVSGEAVDAYMDAPDYSPCGHRYNEPECVGCRADMRGGLRAAAPHLIQSWIAGLTEEEIADALIAPGGTGPFVRAALTRLATEG